ncbi:MAG: hypothetical protein WCJ81_08195 [bacterium]
MDIENVVLIEDGIDEETVSLLEQIDVPVLKKKIVSAYEALKGRLDIKSMLDSQGEHPSHEIMCFWLFMAQQLKVHIPIVGKLV